MANTTNLNLVKPAGTDHALVSVINGNMDIIDSKVGAVPSNASVQGQIDTLNNQITPAPITIPSSAINSKITVTAAYARKMGYIRELYFNGSANADISAWETLFTIPSGYRMYFTQNAYQVNVGTNVYVCNISNDGTVNVGTAISSGTAFRIHAIALGDS